MMKLLRRFLLVLIVLGAVLGGLYAYKMKQMEQMQAGLSQSQPPAPVEVAEVRREEWTAAISAVGSFRAINGVAVANEVAGVVREVNFESGQSVEGGEVLIRLDSGTDQAALETRKAEAQLALQQYRRFENLLPQRAVSQSQYDEAEAGYQAAQARVVEAQAQLDKKIIRAPFSGILGLRQVDLGEFLPVGSAIVEVNQLDPIYLEYSLAEKELARVAVGDQVEARVAAYPEEAFSGRISALDVSVLAETRTFRVRATLDNPRGRLRPGMFATLRTLRKSPSARLVVPRTAVSYNPYGDFVFVLVEDDDGVKVENRAVTTGEIRDGKVAVVEGLEAGERVVSTGLLRLRNGQSVVPEEASAGKDAAEPSPDSGAAEAKAAQEGSEADA